MIYNIDFDLSACLIFAFILFLVLFRKGFYKLSNRIYFALICVGLLSAITDAVSGYLISYPELTSRTALDFWNYSFLVLHNTMPPLFLLYVLSLTERIRRLKTWQWITLFVPLAVSLAFLASNPITHLVFDYTKENYYFHGPFFSVLYIIAFLYMFATIVIVAFYRRLLPFGKKAAIIACVIFCAVPLLIQIFHQNILMEIFFQSIGLMSILFSIENDDEVTSKLTGVYNRFAFLQDVERGMFSEVPLFILTVKLYNIHYANSTFGVQFMGSVLKKMAEWLDKLVKGVDCYDCSDGHFALLFFGGEREEAEHTAERIKERFDEEWVVKALSVVFPAQICVLEFPKEVASVDQLMLILDVPAEENPGASQIVAPNTMHSYQREVVIEQKINEALKQNRFQVYFQPILDVEKGTITSAEALLRLEDEELGFIPPDEFIPIAERNGSILELGAFVISETCRFFSENRLDTLGVSFIDVNLSVVQCMNHRLPQTIQNILDGYHLPPTRLNLEITESAAAGNKTALEDTVRLLSGNGIPIALDDYGTGYSNYSYMFALPFSMIKVDKSILWSALDTNNHPGEESAMILLENTVRMLKQMQYRVVVEGVETEAQKDLLTNLGCDYLQGFLFSRALPGDQFLEFVRRFNQGNNSSAGHGFA